LLRCSGHLQDSTKRTLKKIESILTAWENLAPEDEFHGMNASEFREAVRPVLEVRERMRVLEVEMAALLQQRLMVDEKCHRLAMSVASAVRGTREHGPNSPLYAAMGYIPDAAKKAGRPRKSRQADGSSLGSGQNLQN
jgi:hypothetical protein